jgi:tetratricopeptide (TPR) repeat protein
MGELPRIDDLRRRVQKDPASIAFAQLAEELRRAGLLDEAVDTARTGLVLHPEYVSARVTLGRALLALGQLDEASAELSQVLATAPDNLAATRALADTCRQQGRLPDAFAHYSAALTFAPKDPDLERTLSDLGQALAADRRSESLAERHRATATIAALEHWLEAIHATRPDGRS